ncbi:hypothetical protein BZG35_16870 [Brevundimonas sp. LM2]|uniref:alginate export family protein n=1 Tax=Brevundimonas sp. LM2 TaxID=1938605 RepID=UPI000983BD86|nr:alginate export family protein [Brevundimonas sp. LM2]AQR63134.1 hypothetical protein BZG35_16870 [Brevundimonas sp. LM2]
MKTIELVLGGAMLAVLSTPALAQTAPPAPPAPAGDGIKPIAEARVRYEGVDRDAPLTDADAVTARLRFGFEARQGVWSMLAEAEGVLALADDYNDTNAGNGMEPFATIADPANLELNRVQIQYRTAPLTVTLGRQRINLDDQRFVGSVGWRQSEQTFDAVRAEGTLGRVKLDLAYSNNQRTVFGVDAGPRERFDGDFVLLGAGVVAGPVTLKAFGYLLDFEETIQFGNSSDTFGLRATGAIPLSGHVPITVAASYARQTYAGSNPGNYAADYLALDLGTAVAGFTVNAGYEQLGADNGHGFQTPLATLHKFNGWADVFLTTPAQGLRDAYVGVGRRFPSVTGLPGMSAQISYHDFSSDVGGSDYGTEWDAQIGFKPGRFGVVAKYASYQADGYSADIRKVWLQLEWAL